MNRIESFSFDIESIYPNLLPKRRKAFQLDRHSFHSHALTMQLQLQEAAYLLPLFNSIEFLCQCVNIIELHFRFTFSLYIEMQSFSNIFSFKCARSNVRCKKFSRTELHHFLPLAFYVVEKRIVKRLKCCCCSSMNTMYPAIHRTVNGKEDSWTW